MRTLIACALLAVGAAAHANEMFVHPLHVHIKGKWLSRHHEISAWGKVEGIGVTVSAMTSGDPERLTSFTLMFGELKYDANEAVMSEVVDPHFRDITVTSDTGVYGDHYSVELPFGPTKECHYEGRVHHWRASFEIHINNGTVDKNRIYSPCRD